MQIEYIDIKNLKGLDRNPRKINKLEFDRLCHDIQKDPDFFEMRPCLVNKTGNIFTVYAGNQRLKAAKKLGWKQIPCIVCEDADDQLMKARIIKDNMHNGYFDFEILACDYEIDELVEYGFKPEELGINLEMDDLSSENKSTTKKLPKECPHCGKEI